LRFAKRFADAHADADTLPLMPLRYASLIRARGCCHTLLICYMAVARRYDAHAADTRSSARVATLLTCCCSYAIAAIRLRH